MSIKMASPKLHTHSENRSSYKLICNMTDTFTCCIRIYEALLPDFEKERTSDANIYSKLLKIEEILSKLNAELTTLKTEFISVAHEGPKLAEQSVQVKVISENENKGSKSQCVSHEDKNRDKQIFHDKNDVRKSSEKTNKEGSAYQDVDLSNVLNEQKCSKQELSKTIETQSVGENGSVDGMHAQSCPKKTLDGRLLKIMYEAEGGSFNNIWPTESGFYCSLCHKKLSGPKVIIQHVRGSYHQNLLADLVENRVCDEQDKDGVSVVGSTVSNESYSSNIDTALLEKVNKMKSVLSCVSEVMDCRDLYILHNEGVFLCALCGCEIPPTVQNVRGHLSGAKHSKNMTIAVSQ